MAGLSLLEGWHPRPFLFLLCDPLTVAFSLTVLCPSNSASSFHHPAIPRTYEHLWISKSNQLFPPTFKVSHRQNYNGQWPGDSKLHQNTKIEVKIYLMHYLPITSILIVLAHYGSLQQTTPSRTFLKEVNKSMQEKRNVYVLLKWREWQELSAIHILFHFTFSVPILVFLPK